jgi:hypothetical protein
MLDYLTDQGLLKKDRDWFVDDPTVSDKSGFFTVAGLLSGDERCVGLNLSLVRKYVYQKIVKGRERMWEVCI